jgi:hypothetical protein
MITANLLPLEKRMSIDDVADNETKRTELAVCKGVTIIPHGGERNVQLAPQHNYFVVVNEPKREYCLRCYELMQNYVRHGMRVV